jgi:hypothetical protein
MAAGISFRIFLLPLVHPPPLIYPGIKIHQTLFLTGGSDMCMQKNASSSLLDGPSRTLAFFDGMMEKKRQE